MQMSPSEDKPLLCLPRVLPASPCQLHIYFGVQPPRRLLLMSNLNSSCCKAPALVSSA